MDADLFERLYRCDLAIARRWFSWAARVDLAAAQHYRVGRKDTGLRVLARANEYRDRGEMIFERLERYLTEYEEEANGGERVSDMQEHLPTDATVLEAAHRPAGTIPGDVPQVPEQAHPGAQAPIQGNAQYNPYG